MILIEDDAIAVEHGRARAPMVVVESAELLVPQELPLEVETCESVGSERCVDPFSIRHRCGRGVAVLLVDVLDAFLGNSGIPEAGSIRTAIAEERKTLALIPRSGEEDAIAPDDG
jgi:hypothetical protein